MKPQGSGPAVNFWGRWAAALPLVVLAILAVWSLFQYGPPGDIDAPNHFYRFVALDWHIAHGDWYPRWFTDINYGLGGPVLNFYAPLSYYILVAIRAVVGSAVLAFTLGFALAIALALVGMYGWVKDQFRSPWAGLVAAAAYGLSPYIYINLLRRGALPELWGLALAPWLFWAMRRVIVQPHQGNRVALSLLYAALILTHNLSAVLFTVPLVIYGLVQIGKQGNWWAYVKAWLPIGLSLGLGVLVSAFFWLPFLSEVSFIQLQRASIDYWKNFLGWGELFALPPVYDSDYITYVVPYSLPWPQILLAVVGLWATWKWRAQRRETWRVAVAAALQVLAFAVLMNAISQPLWSTSRLANFIQFPWRLLGPSGLWLAWLSGSALAAIGRTRWRTVAGVGLTVLFFVYVYNWTYGGEPTRSYPSTATSLDVNRFEIDNPTWAGTTVAQEFLPKWVQTFKPGATPAITFESDPTPSRLAPLPQGVTLVSEQHTINSWTVTYTAPQDFTAAFYQFYFPGWAAAIDGQAVEPTASEPEGFVLVKAPAGTHTLTLGRTATLPQQAGSVIAVIALVLLFVPWPKFEEVEQVTSATPLSIPSVAVWTGGLVVLLVLKLVVLDNMEAPFRVAGAQRVPNPINAQFGEDLAVIGYGLPHGAQVASGGQLDVMVYWKATAAQMPRYSTSVQLIDGYGNRFGQADNYIPGNVPTPFWPVGHYARDLHILKIPNGTPPGSYHLQVSAYSGDTPDAYTPLALQDGSGLDYELATTVTVTPAPAGPDVPLAITGGSLAGDTVGVGDPLAFTAQYYSGNVALPDLRAQLILTDASGKQIFMHTLAPARPDYATTAWALRQTIQYPQSLILPPDLPAGQVQAQLRLIQADGSPATEPFALGSLAITVPERSFTVPAISHATQATFNGAIQLLGYDMKPDSLTFYWQALHPIEVPLTVFIHKFRSDGSFEDGQDSPPTRAVTSWLPGEVITDVHPFAAGDRFEVGFYQTATGERFGEPFQVKP